MGTAKNSNILQKTTGFSNEPIEFLETKTKIMGKSTGTDFLKNPKIDITKSGGNGNSKTINVGNGGNEKTLLKRGLSNKKK